jgi:O-glycosyl hydrolase
MHKKIFYSKLTSILVFVICFFQLTVNAQYKSVSLKVDGANKFQQIDGFGVNINSAWWYNGDFRDSRVTQPAIDMLIDSLGVTIFRAIIEEMDWETVNDDKDPNNFNWNFYNKVFSNKRFQGVWNTLRYLNKKGITDKLIISFMGGPPSEAPLVEKDSQKSWMGDTDYSISPSMENEFVESIAALLYYARNTAKIQFTLVSPLNETDIVSSTRSADHPEGIVEGPNIPDAGQLVRIIEKLARKLDAIGMGDIRFVAPDAAGDQLFASCFKEMTGDSYLMSKIAHWGVHDYGNNAGNYYTIINKPENPNKSLWVTEMAGIGNLMGQLGDSARSFLFWDGFDCVYQHARRNGYGDVPPNDWVFWYGPKEGKPLLQYIPSTNSWAPRKQFYQFAQVLKFVKPGSKRISSITNDSNLIVRSFLNPDGKLVIVGLNTEKESITLKGTLTNMPSFDRLSMTYTNNEKNLQADSDISAYLPWKVLLNMTRPEKR